MNEPLTHRSCFACVDVCLRAEGVTLVWDTSNSPWLSRMWIYREWSNLTLLVLKSDISSLQSLHSIFFKCQQHTVSFIFHTNTLKFPPQSQTNNLSLPWYAELFSINGENTIPSNRLTCSSVFHYYPKTDFCIYAQLQQNQDTYCVMSLQTLTSEQVILLNWLFQI